MKFGYLTLGVALLAALPAYAHEAKSLHGGRLVEAGPYHVELVTKDTAIEIFLIGENNKPVDPKGFKGVGYFQSRRKSRAHHALTFGESSLGGTAATALPASPQGRGSAHRAGWQDGDGAIRLTRRDGALACRQWRSSLLVIANRGRDARC